MCLNYVLIMFFFWNNIATEAARLGFRETVSAMSGDPPAGSGSAINWTPRRIPRFPIGNGPGTISITPPVGRTGAGFR